MQMPDDIRRRNGTVLATAVAIFIVLVVVQGVRLGFVPLAWGWHDPYYQVRGVALAGYDPVAYHEGDGAVLGAASIDFRWRDLEWRFMSDENRALFQTAPESYAPRLGGFCAKAVSSGFAGGGNPKVWHIEDGHLFFFFSEGAKEGWLAEIDQGIVDRSENNWQSH